jgi:FMN phosphatase YigB (HAD superfamily)
MTPHEAFWMEFKRVFASLKYTPVVLYGTGPYSSVVIEHAQIDGFNIVALMDGYRKSGVFHGLPIIDSGDIKKYAKHIIIVSMLSVRRIIFSRISYLIDEGVEIFFCNGEKFAQATTPDNIIDIYRYVEGFNVISLDVFDTLIMRKCLYPNAIFDIMEKKTGLKGFRNIRISDGDECSKKLKRIADLDSIYDYIAEKHKWDAQQSAMLKNLEIELEYDYILPIKPNIELLNYALKQGKEVFLVSDMYLKRGIIERLLEKCQIQGYKDIFISCEWNYAKSRGDIWQYVKSSSISGGKHLHIGDNPESDGASPERAGIASILTKNSVNILNQLGVETSPNDKIENNTAKALFIGNAAKDINVFYNKYAKIQVSDCFDVGYCFFGPLVYSFVNWIAKESKQKDVSELLFFSRDGYIFKKAYDKLFENHHQRQNARYFLVSRRAASVAAIENLDDIKLMLKYNINQSSAIADILKNDFGLSNVVKDEFNKNRCCDLTEEDIVNYIETNFLAGIIRNSANERDNYLKYMQKMDLNDKNVGIVNFIGRGATQFYLEKLLKRDIYGFYVGLEEDIKLLYPSFPKRLMSLYPELISPIMSKLGIAKAMLFGECIFTSPDEQLLRFDSNANPIFADKQHERSFEKINAVHHGIMQYIDEMQRLAVEPCDTDVLDGFLNLLPGEWFEYDESVKKAFVFDGGVTLL